MREVYSCSDDQGLKVLLTQLSYDEVIELLKEAGIVPAGLEIVHWWGGMNDLRLEFRRPERTTAGQS